jgi:hypothetical protein
MSPTSFYKIGSKYGGMDVSLNKAYEGVGGWKSPFEDNVHRKKLIVQIAKNITEKFFKASSLARSG